MNNFCEYNGVFNIAAILEATLVVEISETASPTYFPTASFVPTSSPPTYFPTASFLPTVSPSLSRTVQQSTLFSLMTRCYADRRRRFLRGRL